MNLLSINHFIRPNYFIPPGPKPYMLKFLTAVLAFFPLLSMITITPHSFTQSKNKNSYRYVVLIRDNKLECVSSLTEKSHLLPDFISAPVKKKRETLLFDQRPSPNTFLADFPVCNKEQEDFISLSAKKMTEGPLQTAGYGLLAFKLIAYGVNCFASFKFMEYGYEDPASHPYAIVALATTLLPAVSLKSPLICASAGAIISYLNDISSGFNTVEGHEGVLIQEGTRKNKHPYLNSVVTVHKTFKKSDMPVSVFHKGFSLLKDIIGSNDSTTESDSTTEKKMKNREADKEGEIQTKEETQDFFDDRFFPACHGSGFFVDEDKIITNYHVIESKFRKNEYTAKYVIELADGSKVSVKEVLAQGEERDLALLQTAFPVGTPVRLGDSDKLNLLDDVVIAGAPIGFENSLAKGHVSQIRGIYGKSFIQYTAPTSPGNSGGALFLEDSQELIGVPTLGVYNFVGQNLNLAIPVNDVKKFLEENGY